MPDFLPPLPKNVPNLLRGRGPHSMPRHPPHPIRRRILGGILAATVFTPWSAHAHAILEASYPPSKGQVPAGVVAVRLQYNSRIDHARSVLTLIRADKTRTAVPIDTETSPEIIAATLDLPSGDYTLRWQVLAIDGHITRGDLPFIVTGP